MERFRLRVRHEPKRGQIWELHLFPSHPRRPLREADGRLMGSSSTPEAIYWLRQIATPFLLRAEAPAPLAAEKFGPDAKPRWLKLEDGMRLALAFSAARWLSTPSQRRMFQEGLEELPSEVVLYWFTLCFYGYRQAAGRAAFRTLLTHEEPGQSAERARSSRRKRKPEPEPEPELVLFPLLVGKKLSESHHDAPLPYRAMQRSDKEADFPLIRDSARPEMASEEKNRARKSGSRRRKQKKEGTE